MTNPRSSSKRGSRSKSPKRSSGSRGSGGSLVKGPFYKSSSHTKSNVLTAYSIHNKETLEMPYLSHIISERKVSKVTGQPGKPHYRAAGYTSNGAGKKKLSVMLTEDAANYISKEYGVKIKKLADRAPGTRKPRKATCEARKAKRMAIVQEAFDECIEKRKIRRKRSSASKSPKRSSASKSRSSASKKKRATTSGATKKRKAPKKTGKKKAAAKRASH